MKLIVNSRYSTQTVAYSEGQVIEVTEAEAAVLMADSPGTFSPAEVPAAAIEDVPAEASPRDAESPPEAEAMSTETATGLVAPDRRARGGKKR